jgi:hypothetical protein
MADVKVSALTALTGANLANGDQFLVTDVGSPNVSKSITADELAQGSQFTSRFVPKAGDALWFGPEQMQIGAEGTPSRGFVNGVNAMLFDQSARELVTVTAYPPQHWATMHADVWWSNAGAGAGNIFFECYQLSFGDGDTIPGNNLLLNAVATAPAQNVVEVTRISSSAITVTAGKAYQFLIGRKGSDATDTLGNDAGFLALVISRAS